jgi:predicted metal-dependent hydrolase
MATEDYDSRYLQGIEYFNDCEFFEAHEIWEELWSDSQGPSRKFYQGLIQAAVCLHHFGNGNLHGARKLYYSCRERYLEQYRPLYLGVDLDRFLEQLEACCRLILDADADLSQVEIDAETIPEIHLGCSPGEAPAESL